jgi:hypothetical protein
VVTLGRSVIITRRGQGLGNRQAHGVADRQSVPDPVVLGDVKERPGRHLDDPRPVRAGSDPALTGHVSA